MGHSLGLAISNQLAELMGGKILLKSKENEGSTFILCLDLDLGLKTHQDLQKTSNQTISFEGRILIVEDNHVNQKVILKLVQKLGLQADVVVNGQKAVEQVQADHAYDLVLMDLQMPVMDGLEATTKIRAFNKELPIIALTANVSDGISETCLKTGMNDFLSKPLKKSYLVNALQEFLPEKTSI